MSSVLPTAVRVLVTLLAIAGTAGQVTYLDTLWWHALGLTDTLARDVSTGLIIILAAHAIVSVMCAVMAIVLVVNEGEWERAARGLGLAFGAWAYLMAYSGVTMLLRPDPGVAREIFEGHFLFVEVLGLVGLLRFTSLFPHELIPQRIEPPDNLPAALLPVNAATVWMLRPSAPLIAGVVVVVSLWSLAVATGGVVADAGLSPLMNVIRFVAAGLVVVNLRRAWTRADDEGRARLLWLLAGLVSLLGAVAVMIGGKVLVAVAGFREPPVAWHPILLDLGMVGFFGGMALSLLYHGPVTALSVVRRITTICTIVSIGLFLAAALEALLSGGVLVSFALRPGVGSALAAATVVSTYRSWVRLVQRMFPGT